MGSTQDFILVGGVASLFSMLAIAAARRKILNSVLNIRFFGSLEPVIRFVYWVFMAIVVVVDVLFLLSVLVTGIARFTGSG